MMRDERIGEERREDEKRGERNIEEEITNLEI